MKVFQLRGYPQHHYFIKDPGEWYEFCRWCWENNVEYLQESSSLHGIGFSIRKNFDWFALKWL
jgi:hypothetical protein